MAATPQQATTNALRFRHHAPNREHQQQQKILEVERMKRWVDEADTVEILEHRYDSLAPFYDKRTTTSSERNLIAIAVSALARKMGGESAKKRARILDAGAGTGLVGEVLRKEGFGNLVALDVSQGMLNEARKKGVYKEYHKMLLGEHLLFDSDSFDCVISVHTLNFHYMPEGTLDEMVRIVKPDGYVLFTLRADDRSESGRNPFLVKAEELEREGKWRLMQRVRVEKGTLSSSSSSSTLAAASTTSSSSSSAVVAGGSSAAKSKTKQGGVTPCEFIFLYRVLEHSMKNETSLDEHELEFGLSATVAEQASAGGRPPADLKEDPATSGGGGGGAFPFLLEQEYMWLSLHLHATAQSPSAAKSAVGERGEQASLYYRVPNNEVFFIQAVGDLDETLLRKTLATIVARHQLLRATWGRAGRRPPSASPSSAAAPGTSQQQPLVMVVAPPPPRDASGFDFDEIVDLSDASFDEKEKGLARLADEACNYDFRLHAMPSRLMRATLVRLGKGEHRILFVLHPLVADSNAGAILRKEIARAYQAYACGRGQQQQQQDDDPLPPREFSCSAYARWQGRVGLRAKMHAHMRYWRDVLGDKLPVCQVPFTKPRPPPLALAGAASADDPRAPANRRSYAFDVASVKLSAQLSSALRALSARHGVSLATTFIAAFKLLLFRYTNQDEIVVGAQMEYHPFVQLKRVVGPFQHTVLLRTKFDPRQGFAELLANVDNVVRHARENASVPLDAVLEEALYEHRPTSAEEQRDDDDDDDEAEDEDDDSDERAGDAASSSDASAAHLSNGVADGAGTKRKESAGSAKDVSRRSARARALLPASSMHTLFQFELDVPPLKEMPPPSPATYLPQGGESCSSSGGSAAAAAACSSPSSLFSAASSASPAALEPVAFKLKQKLSYVNRFDRIVTVSESKRDKRLRVKMQYERDLVESTELMEQMLRHYEMILSVVACNSTHLAMQDIPILPPAERHRIATKWNSTECPFSSHLCVHQLVEDQAAVRPDAVAVECEDRRMTYGELDARANQLARYLAHLGVGPEALVGVYLERSPDLLVALLAVLKAGGAYVPLDPIYPPERLAYMLEDAAASVVVSQQSLLGSLPAQGAKFVCVDTDWEDSIACLSTDPLPLVPAPPAPSSAASSAAATGGSKPRSSSSNRLARTVVPNNRMYVIYTSGSTGRPKGVQISHASVVNLLECFAKRLGVAPGDKLMAVTTVCFDIAGLELFLPLVSGAAVHIAPQQTATDGFALLDLMRKQQPTVMQATPTTWKLLVAAGWSARTHPMLSALKVLCGGEALPKGLAKAILQRTPHLWNVYGPTETTIWSTMERITRQGAEQGLVVSIGRPIDNTQIFLFDRRMHLVPVGIPGELHIGGVGLTLGYLNRPQLNKEKFVDNPYSGLPGDTLYKTNDLAVYMPDGRIKFLGRMDNQVKIRGYRIELGEIESVLSEAPMVGEAVVLAHDVGGDDKQLVAYLVPPSSGVKRATNGREQDDTKDRQQPSGDREQTATTESEANLQQQQQRKQQENGGDEARKEDGRKPQQQQKPPPAPNPAADAKAGDADDVERELAQWQEIYNQAYASQNAVNEDPTLNFSGYDDSYTGEPHEIPVIREWVETTCDRILSCRPRHLLEMGCGNGMLLFRIAPRVERYVGGDLSEQAVAYVSNILENDPKFNLPHVSVKKAGAHEFELFSASPDASVPSFDTVVVNGVVMYFPSIEYLLSLVRGAVEHAIESEGTLFLGDIRSLAHLEHFHAAVQLFQADDALPLAKLKRRIFNKLRFEKELLVHPQFFLSVMEHVPGIASVRVQLKRGVHHSEFSRYRYDVFLRVDKRKQSGGGSDDDDGPSRFPKGAIQVVDYDEPASPSPGTLSSEQIRARLMDMLSSPPNGEGDAGDRRPDTASLSHAALLLRHVPNARLTKEHHLVELLRKDKADQQKLGLRTAADLRKALLEHKDPRELDPETLYSLLEKDPRLKGRFEIDITFSPDRKSAMDVLIWRADLDRQTCDALRRHPEFVPLHHPSRDFPPLTAEEEREHSDGIDGNPHQKPVSPWERFGNKKKLPGGRGSEGDDPLGGGLRAGFLDAKRVQELKNMLRQKLPDYMIPAHYVLLARWPLTPNGKIDKKALPSPLHVKRMTEKQAKKQKAADEGDDARDGADDEGEEEDEEEYVAPETPTEKALAEMWAELFGVPRVGARADFADMGGHSLLAMQLISWVRTRLKAELNLRTIFEFSTLRNIAERIDRHCKRIDALEGSGSTSPTSAGGGGSDSQGPAVRLVTDLPYDIVEDSAAWVGPLSDGVRLGAHLWRPKADDPVPAILDYVPYPHRTATAIQDSMNNPYFAGHGFAVVRVDLRGCGESDGLFDDEYSEKQHRDALEVIDWIADQPWCNGRVGMMGISWGGFNALQVASYRPPALKAIVVLCATDDRYADDMHYMGGCLLTENFRWSAAMMRHLATPPDPDLIVGGMPAWREMWKKRLEALPPLAQTWLSHQERDEYWRRGSVAEDYAKIRCPVFAIGGWAAGGYANSVPRLLERLSVPRKGVVGPWAHEYPNISPVGPQWGFLAECLDWWQRWLAEEDGDDPQRGEEREKQRQQEREDPTLTLWMREHPGSRLLQAVTEHMPGRWIQVKKDFAEGADRPLELDICPRGLENATNGSVDPSRSTTSPYLMTISSPESVGCAAGGWFTFGVGPEMPIDQREDDGRSLCFDTLPITDALPIVGAPAALLSLVAGTHPKGMIAARLCDVAPNGASHRITYGVLNLTHLGARDEKDDDAGGEMRLLPVDHSTPVLMEPGKTYDVRVVMNYAAYNVPKGHRLRLAISSHYWPIVWPCSPASSESTAACSGTGGGRSLSPFPSLRTGLNCGSRLTLPVPRSPSRVSGLGLGGEDVSIARALQQRQPLPEVAKAIAFNVIRPSVRSRRNQHDLATGEKKTVVVDNDGLVRLHRYDMEMEASTTTTYSVVDGDPTSASVKIEWASRRARGSKKGGFEAKVTGTCEMRCTDTTFIVKNALKAFVGSNCIFYDKRETEIARRFT